jgi:hypothetical protein
VRVHFDLRPAAIIHNLKLRRPIYLQTTAYGHFGRPDLDLPWEKTDKAAGAAQRRRRRPGTRAAHRLAVTRPKPHRNGHRASGARFAGTLRRYSAAISTMLGCVPPRLAAD